MENQAQAVRGGGRWLIAAGVLIGLAIVVTAVQIAVSETDSPFGSLLVLAAAVCLPIGIWQRVSPTERAGGKHLRIALIGIPAALATLLVAVIAFSAVDAASDIGTGALIALALSSAGLILGAGLFVMGLVGLVRGLWLRIG